MGTELQRKLKAYSPLKDKQTDTRLQQHIIKLQQLHLDKRETSIYNLSLNLEAIIEKLVATVEDVSARLQLEDQALQQIQELKQISLPKAVEFEQRLYQLLGNLLETSKINPQSSNPNTFHELQRRICQYCRTEKTLDIEPYLIELALDPHFRDILPDYNKRRQNVIYTLNRLKGKKAEFTNQRIKALLEIREDFGEFPELDIALEETNREIARQKNLQLLNTLLEQYQQARNHGDWRELTENIKKIQPSLLNPTESVNTTKWKKKSKINWPSEKPLTKKILLNF